MQQEARNFIRNFLIYGVGSVAQSAANFLLIPLFTDSYSATEYGRYTMIWVIGTVFSSFLYLGIASALPKFFYSNESHRERSIAFSSGYSVVFLGMIVQIFIGLIFSSLMARTFFDGDEYSSHILFSLMGGAIGFLNYYLISFLRILEKAISFIIFNMALTIATLLLTYYLITTQEDKLFSPFLATFIVNLSFLIILSLFFSKKSWLIFSLDLPLAKKMLTFGIPLALSSIASMIVDWSDRFILEYFSGLDSVGIYSISYKIAGLVNILLITPFIQIWGPLMMKKKDQPGTMALFHTVFRAYICTAFSILLFILFFYQIISPYIIRSASYGDTLYLVFIITSGLLAYGLSNVLYCGLLYANKTQVVMWINYSCALLNISITFLLVPFYGAYGAAVSTLVSYICVPLIMHHFSKKYFDFRPFAENAYSLSFTMLVILILFLMYSYYSVFYIYLKVIIFVLLNAVIWTLFFYRYIAKNTRKSNSTIQEKSK